ncbi:MAG TPA: HAD family hydrolase [Dehalococcoidia bacterium]|nr:HAD family hydrolase [Dehalococcoidia bacterium]
MGRFPHAIFLDLDDTIIDDSSSVDSGWRAAIEEHAGGLDTEALTATVFEVRTWYWSDPSRHRLGRLDLRAISTRIVEEALSRLGHRAPALAHRIGHRYRDIRDEAQALLPGAVESIENLRDQGIRLALLTNGSKESQRAKIERFDLARHFDYICVEGEFGCGKPDERVYRSALEALSAQPETTWMTGDNLEWDVAAPMRLGITGIWLDRHKTGLPDASPVQPHRIILSLNELL